MKNIFHRCFVPSGAPHTRACTRDKLPNGTKGYEPAFPPIRCQDVLREEVDTHDRSWLQLHIGPDAPTHLRSSSMKIRFELGNGEPGNRRDLFIILLM